ncbi:hypothetical protein JB92DRAFT_3266105 [Gautieria morchelliformis]|nr:hypothetical protein JB92DRAFT_3266105 [Gautieria morchelliformis]
MADAAIAPIPVLLILSPEAVRCSTRCDTAVLFPKLHPYAERRGLEGLSSSLMGTGRRLCRTASGDRSITGARNDGNTRKGNQWKSLAPNSDWQQKHDRDSSKLARSGGRSTRSEVACQEPEVRNPQRSVHTWHRVANSSLKRHMGHVGETIITQGMRQNLGYASRQNKGQDNGGAGAQAEEVEGRRKRKRAGRTAAMEWQRHLQATNSDHNETTRTTKNEAALSSSGPSPSSPESPAIGVTSSLLPIINVSHGRRSNPRPSAGIITPSFPAPASRRAIGYMESVAQACSGAILGWGCCGDGRAEVMDVDPGGEVVMERWDKGRCGRGFKKSNSAAAVFFFLLALIPGSAEGITTVLPRSAFIPLKEEHVTPSDLVSRILCIDG